LKRSGDTNACSKEPHLTAIYAALEDKFNLIFDARFTAIAELKA
jgi:hypothetical protein